MQNLTPIIVPEDVISIVMPISLIDIQNFAFYGCIALATVFYDGDAAQWNALTINLNNDALAGVTSYYYSTENYVGYWHYVGDVPTSW